MMETIHRVMSGQADTRRQLIGCGIFVAVWFGMDVVMFVDFVVSKLR